MGVRISCSPVAIPEERHSTAANVGPISSRAVAAVASYCSAIDPAFSEMARIFAFYGAEFACH